MKGEIKIEIVLDILKRRTGELRADYDKLKAVDKLIGESATATKKYELLNIIFALQDVQHEILNAIQEQWNREHYTKMFQQGEG